MNEAIANNSNDVPVGLVAIARNRVNFGLDICELQEMESLEEADLWIVSADLMVLLSRFVKIQNVLESASDDLLKGIDMLESLYRRSSNDAYNLPLIAAYQKMYAYSKDERWKNKLQQVLATSNKTL